MPTIQVHKETNMNPPSRKKDETFFTVPEIMERWQISERTLRRLIASGALPVLRIGASVRVSEADLRAYERMNRYD